MVDLDRFGVARLYPTVTNGKKWLSRWDNGHQRTLQQDTWDPYDSQFGFHLKSGPPIKLVIDGQGKAILPTDMQGNDSQRLFVTGPWTNVEMTVYVRYRTRIWNTFQLRSRSNHHGTNFLPYGFDTTLKASCGFGNYEAIWGGSQGPNSVRNSVEVIHDLYSNVVSSGKSVSPLIDQWVGHKFVTRTVTSNNSVKCEAWSNINNDKVTWNKETEFTYTGQNVHIDPTGKEAKVTYCLNRGDKIAGQLDKNTLWLNPGKWCWIRINGGDNMELKYFSIREIAAL